MHLPLSLSSPIFYFLSTKTSLIITSIPTKFELKLRGGVEIKEMHGMTARIQATRSQMAIVPTGENFCVSFTSDTSRIEEPELFKAILKDTFDEFVNGEREE